jgi:DNA-binding NarL/FixJ family response regulator
VRAEIQESKLLTNARNGDRTDRLRAVIADASPEFMSVVLRMLEFHEVVDLIGRAATFEEVVQLVLKQQPDLVLIDLEMPLANLAIPAMILASRRLVTIVGMCAGQTVSSTPVEIMTTVDALIHKGRLREELPSFLRRHFRNTAAAFSISSPPEREHAMNRWRSGFSLQDDH